MSIESSNTKNINLLCRYDTKMLSHACSMSYLNDHFIFCESAVHLLLDPDALHRLSLSPVRIYVLEQDALAHGVKPLIEQTLAERDMPVSFIDYSAMVSLTEQSDKWLSWC